MAIDPSVTNNFLDSCAFDPKDAPEDRASGHLFELYKKGKLLLLEIAHSTQKEIEHPNTPAWVKAEAQNLIYTIQVRRRGDFIGPKIILFRLKEERRYVTSEV